jgi:hypothetical protein
MSDVLSLALKQSPRILQGGSAEKAKLYIPSVAVDVRYGRIPADPAPVSPLHSLAKPWLNAFHELPKRTDDHLIFGSLVLKVIIEARVCFHLFITGSSSALDEGIGVGFSHAKIRAINLTRTSGAEPCFQVILHNSSCSRKISGTLREKMARLAPAQLPTGKQTVADAAQKYFVSGTMNFPAEALIVSGRRSMA